MWKILDHTADLRVACAAPSWHELLAEAPRCLGLLVLEGVADAGGRALPAATSERALDVAGLDASETWVLWWRACLRLVHVERLLPIGARVDASSTGARSRGTVDCASLGGLELRGVELKAVTWHGARAELGVDGTWRGEIVLDV